MWHAYFFSVEEEISQLEKQTGNNNRNNSGKRHQECKANADQPIHTNSWASAAVILKNLMMLIYASEVLAHGTEEC